MAKRSAKHITNPKDVEYILSIDHNKAIRKSTIMDLFADFGDGPRYNPYDTILIPKGKFGNKRKNKNEFITTVGLYVFNKAFIEPLDHVLTYVNEPVTSKIYDRINKDLSYALMEEKITVQDLKTFIMQTQIMMGCASAICPSHTMDLLLISTKVEPKKRELERQNADGIKNKDLNAIKAVENGLIDFMKEELKDSEAVDMFNSGARSSWGNQVKNMYGVKGAVKKTDGSYEYVRSSYMSGLDKEDFSVTNDAAVGGPYSRSKKTASGGYNEKLFTRATQHIKILPKGSDCGSKHTITVTLTKDNIDGWMYSFIQNKDGSVTEITSENRNKLLGKTVQMRFSALCQSKNGICETCAGTMFRRAGIANAGLTSMIMQSSVKNTAMKNFHNSTLQLATLDPDKIFSLN